MRFVSLNGSMHHFRYRGGDGIPVVFLNSLGTDLRIWDGVIEALGADGPLLLMDKRGHGLSAETPITMEALVRDVAALMDHHGLSGAVIAGVSVGGMIAQGLAAVRPDLVRGLILCCTAAQIGEAASWNARISAVEKDGLDSIADAVMERWFSEGYGAENPAGFAGYRNMLTRTPAKGYTGVCAALRDTDLTESTAALSLPTHCIAGENDLATPPDLVRALAAGIAGATFESIANCGHLPCIEHPDIVAGSIDAMRRALS